MSFFIVSQVRILVLCPEDQKRVGEQLPTLREKKCLKSNTENEKKSVGETGK